MINNLPTLKKKFTFCLRLAILCCLLVGLTPQPVQAAAEAVAGAAKQNCAFLYWVEKGETIPSIARKVGISAQALAEANHRPVNAKLKEGMLLCIPHVAKKISDPDLVLKATVYWRHLYLYGSEFPAKHVFTVKLRARNDNVWVKLGVLRSDKNGKIEDDFRIPKEYDDTKYFEICLKDTKTGCKVCKYITRTW